MTNQVRIGVGVKDSASKPIKGISDAFHRLQTQGGQGFAIGAGAAATAKAFSLLDSAASAAINVLGDAVKAAMADEESVSRLGASLNANIKNWDGNTRGIEKNILAAQRLGFEDETLRDSLTVLVGATHSVTKAQRIQAIAMDLARFKGVDLRTASEALIKVEGGHYRALAQLGIKLKEGATQQDALNAVMEIAQGQTEAYANTVAGKLLAAQIKWNEQLENLGTKLLPMAAQGLENFNTGATALGDVLAGKDTPEALAFARAINLITEAQFRAALATLQAKDAFAANQEAAGHLRVTASDLADALGTEAGAASDAEDATKDLRTEFEKTKDAASDLDQAVSDLSDALFGTVQLKGDIAQTAKDLADLKEAGPDSKSAGDTEIFDGKVGALTQRLFELGGEYAKAQGPQAYYDWVQRNTKITDGMSASLIALMVKLRAAALLSSTLPPIGYVKGYVDPINTGRPKPGQARSHGGPISPNEPYYVGEKGPELIVPKSSGTVIPNSSLGGVTVNLTVQGDLRARSKEDVVSALQRAAAFIR